MNLGRLLYFASGLQGLMLCEMSTMAPSDRLWTRNPSSHFPSHFFSMELAITAKLV